MDRVDLRLEVGDLLRGRVEQVLGVRADEALSLGAGPLDERLAPPSDVVGRQLSLLRSRLGKLGFERCILPSSNRAQLKHISHPELVGASSLSECWKILFTS